MIKIVENKIDEAALLQEVKSNNSGAAVLFTGTTRRETAGRITETLHYEAYGDMAMRELERIRTEAMERFDLEKCAVVHRTGEVPLGETSIAVAVSSPHRKHAFESAAWIMDQIKADVPIWKKEVWADGSTEWVHPGAATPNIAEESQ